MRVLIVLVLILTHAAAATAAQKSAPRPAPPPEIEPAPAPRPAPPAPRPATTSRGGMAVVVTSLSGSTLGGVNVDVAGPTPRETRTPDSGRLELDGLLPGTYRLRFSGDAVTTFEREVQVRSNQEAAVDVVLSPAPEPPPPPAPPEPLVAETPTGPSGEPRTLDIIDVLEDEFIGGDPRRESLLACSGSERRYSFSISPCIWRWSPRSGYWQGPLSHPA